MRQSDIFISVCVKITCVQPHSGPLTPAKICLCIMRYLRVSKHTLRQVSHIEKLTFLRRLNMRNLLALTYAWLSTLGLLRVLKHAIRQGLHVDKLAF